MADNLIEIQDAIFEHLNANIPQDLVEQGVPDADTVRKVDGKVLPYVAMRFGDLQRMNGGRTFVGVRTFDYELPIYLEAVAADASVARKIASGPILTTLLGLKLPYTGEVRKRPGGGQFAITNSNGATEAYMFPSSWAVTVQLIDE